MTQLLMKSKSDKKDGHSEIDDKDEFLLNLSFICSDSGRYRGIGTGIPSKSHTELFPLPIVDQCYYQLIKKVTGDKGQEYIITYFDIDFVMPHLLIP